MTSDRGVRGLPAYWGKWFASIEGGTMKETDLNIFYHLGSSVGGMLGKIEIGMDLARVALDIYWPKPWLEAFLKQTDELAKPLKDARASAQRLLGLVNEIIEHAREHNFEGKLTQRQMIDLSDSRDKFVEDFERDCKKLSVFMVTPKAIYDTRQLIENPEEKFSPAVVAVLPPQTIADLKQAGKCLAFEVPTACAFHVCRGTEALILKYYEVLTGHIWPHHQRDWGKYIKELESINVPSRITSRLAEIKVMERNPYIHPDTDVTLEEAPVVFDMCNGVIFWMAQEIQKKIT
jgi:hypothetical protein